MTRRPARASVFLVPPHSPLRLPDLLGPKSGFPRELARQAWGPVLRRSDVRQAVTWVALGGFLLVAGSVGLAVTGEALVAAVAGLVGVVSGVGALRAHAGDWRAWRAIGDVTPELDEHALVAGETAVFRLRIVPRRGGIIREARATLAPTRTGAHTIPDGTEPLEFPLAPGGSALRAGQPVAFEVPVTLPDDTMTSWYDDAGSRRWTLCAWVHLEGGATWVRELPVFVVRPPADVPVTAGR